jgi:hypothetical protein
MAVNERDGIDGVDEGADDARLAALYRSASVEEPSERLDRVIRDAARLPSGAPAPAPRVPWWHAWRAPFAFAAVGVLSVSVVIIAQREGGEPLTIHAPLPAPAVEPPVQTPAAPAARGDASARSDARAPQTAKAAEGSAAGTLTEPKRAREPTSQDERFSPDESRLRSAAPPPPPLELPRQSRDTDALRSQGVRGLEGEVEQRGEKALPRAERERPFTAAPPPQPAAPQAALPEPPAPPPPPAPPMAQAKPAPPAPPAAKPEAFPRPAAKPMARPPADAGLSSSPAPAARREELQSPALARLVRDLDGRPPSQWIDRIVTLRGQGRREDADALLAEFKRRYPDEPLPAALQ